MNNAIKFTPNARTLRYTVLKTEEINTTYVKKTYGIVSKRKDTHTKKNKDILYALKKYSHQGIQYTKRKGVPPPPS